MKIEEIESKYLPIVRRFLPDCVDLTESIGFEIEKFLSENDSKYKNPRNFRLKVEDDVLSEALYDVVRFENPAKYQEEDLYLPIEGVERAIFLGFDYDV